MENILFDYLSKFIHLTPADKSLFLRLDLFKSYPKGHLLLQPGQYAQESYFVISGCLRNYYLKDGLEITTAFFLEEEGFSPESLINKAPSEYFISCEEESILLVSTPKMEREVLSKSSKLQSLCIQLSEKQLVKKEAELASYIRSTPEERYLHLLATRPTLFQRVPQYQIASFLGIKPESLSRIRKRLAARKNVAS